MQINAYIQMSYNDVTGSSDDPPCDFIQLRVDESLLQSLAEARRQAATGGFVVLNLPEEAYCWCQFGISPQEMQGWVAGCLAVESPRLFEDEPRGKLNLYVGRNLDGDTHSTIALKIRMPDTEISFHSVDSFTPDQLVAGVAKSDRLAMIDMCLKAFGDDPVEMDMLLRAVIRLDDLEAQTRVLPVVGDRLALATGRYLVDRLSFWFDEPVDREGSIYTDCALSPALVAKAFALQRELKLETDVTANSKPDTQPLRSRL